MTTTQTQVAIVGSGPAGIAAARELATAGAHTILVDLYPQPGGHYFKQPLLSSQQPLSGQDARRQELSGLLALLKQADVQVLTETSVWNITREGAPAADGQEQNGVFTLYVQGPHAVTRIESEWLILATGTYDRPIPFPGWTLPGVITPGAAQMLIKGQGILPGKRVIVAGTGPLLLAVGARLVEEGAQVLGVLDAAPLADAWESMPSALWGQWARFAEGWEYWRALYTHRVPILFGHAVFKALGDSEVREVLIGRIDAEGNPVHGTEKTIAVDTLCVGYGLVPSIALTQLLGCRSVYNPQLDAFIPDHQETMETNVPGVFVSGDVTGVGGKTLAMLQGQVAGINILGRLGQLSSVQAQARTKALTAAIRREQRFAKLLERRARIRPGLYALIDDDTVICRCEQVTAGEVKQALQDGARDVRGVKNRTRTGMGNCQGRYCALTVGDMIVRESGLRREDVGFTSVRLPVVPILAKDLLCND